MTGLFNVFLSCPGLCDVLMVEEEELTQSVSSSCQYGVLICMDFFFFFFFFFLHTGCFVAAEKRLHSGLFS